VQISGDLAPLLVLQAEKLTRKAPEILFGSFALSDFPSAAY
jgi:hypothetical protein